MHAHPRHVFAIGITVLVLILGACSAAPRQAQAQDIPLTPGSVFKDCKTCPEMVVVPAGLYIMGLGGTIKREGPAHRVSIAKPFAIGQFEVTFAQWQACLDAGGCSHDPDDHGWGRETRPVINVDFDKVIQYTAWLSATTGKTYRLPSEAEWEYAHRAGTVNAYPWGDDVGVNKANCKDCKSPWSAKSTAPVGSFSPNSFGLYDTVGNAFEWVADCWNPTHEGAPSDGSTRVDGNCKIRVMRGGSFYYFKKVARASYRAKNPAAVKSYWLGFRVARDLPTNE